jgi:hypothetical protein
MNTKDKTKKIAHQGQRKNLNHIISKSHQNVNLILIGLFVLFGLFKSIQISHPTTPYWEDLHQTVHTETI